MPNVELKRGQEVKEDAFEIRRRVFMEEQGYTDELTTSMTPASTSCFTKMASLRAALATFPEPAGSTRWAVGRVAVLPEKREGGFGHMLVEECERAANRSGGDRKCAYTPKLDSRVGYGLIGYTRFGEVDYEDEGQPHIWMEKTISRP